MWLSRKNRLCALVMLGLFATGAQAVIVVDYGAVSPPAIASGMAINALIHEPGRCWFIRRESVQSVRRPRYVRLKYETTYRGRMLTASIITKDKLRGERRGDRI